MGLLDYYRQFEGMSEEEVNARLREDAAERKRKALTRVETLDLSQTTWHELPHPRIVNAITFVARRGLRDLDVGRLASWWHSDADLGRTVETFTDMGKSRRLGFQGVRDTESSFTDLFARLRAERVVP